jgi:hypothetical protein
VTLRLHEPPDRSRIEGLIPDAARYEFTDPAVAGQQLRIEPTGAKSWILRYCSRGERVRFSLGSYPETSQRAAHEAASHARKLLEDGIDPRRAERPSAYSRRCFVSACTVIWSRPPPCSCSSGLASVAPRTRAEDGRRRLFAGFHAHVHAAPSLRLVRINVGHPFQDDWDP